MTNKKYFDNVMGYVAGVLNDIRAHGFIRSYEGLSVEEIVERMKPVPEESMQLPFEFARNVKLIMGHEAQGRIL